VLSHLIQKKIIDCKLCLIAYEKLLKHKVSFVLTDNIFLTKSSVLSAEQNKNIALCLKYSDIYYELVQNAYIHPESTLKINELLCLDVRKKLKQKQLISYDKYIYPLLSDEFDEILKTLKEHEIIFSPQFLPVSQYKS
jgi:hypothetical protein